MRRAINTESDKKSFISTLLIEGDGCKFITMEEDWKSSNKFSLTMNEVEAGLNKKRTRSEARNKNVECMICLQKMRSDTMKRHMRKHRDIYSLDEKDMREEIKERKRQYDNKEARKRLAREIALQENAPMSCIKEDKECIVNTLVDKKKFGKRHVPR